VQRGTPLIAASSDDEQRFRGGYIQTAPPGTGQQITRLPDIQIAESGLLELLQQLLAQRNHQLP